MVCVGTSLGFCTGAEVVDMVCGCCFAEASAPELEKGQTIVRCVEDLSWYKGRAVQELRCIGRGGSIT